MVNVSRMVDHMIIGPRHVGSGAETNITGPSLIRAPAWLPERLGKYYLYFSHHMGKVIQLAYSNNLRGPWNVYEPGTLHLSNATDCQDYVAYPDVHVDQTKRQIRMYFHAAVRGTRQQRSFVASSTDGINFVVRPSPIADFYLKAVRYGPVWIGMSKGGVVYLSKSPEEEFRRLPARIFPMKHPRANAPGDIRHVALHVENNFLWVYFTKIGDAPEKIFRTCIDLSSPVREWKASDTSVIIFPEREWEGANLPVVPSVSGPAHTPENGLRDPAIFEEEGRTYLLYCAAGESGIGIAEIVK